LSRWRGFRTQDPPVFVEIKGRDSAPTVLEAIRAAVSAATHFSGIRETDRKILFPGEAASRITWKSPCGAAIDGDQGNRDRAGAGRRITPVGCPAGWVLIEVSVCYHAEEILGPCGRSRRGLT
jgi:hypothetical protein